MKPTPFRVDDIDQSAHLRKARMAGSGTLRCGTQQLLSGRKGPDTSPLPWFLPDAIRIRGGLARQFSSVWLFHRGSHPEATAGAPN